MRTVLIGSDFMYDNNGNLKPIEINTNVTLNENDKVENIEDVFDFTNLQSFINQKSFTSVSYIGDIKELDTALSVFCSNNTISYTFYQVGGNSLTVPFIEDNDTTLIIRSAYDTTAIIDDTYCADKTNFIELIKNASFGLGYAFIDANNTLQNTITEIVENGVHPNFILKSKYPSYDRDIYPKLFKITTQEELTAVITDNVTSEFFLTPYLFNASKLYNGTHQRVIRSYNLLYPPTLEAISIGQLTMIPSNSVSSNPSYDTNTHVLSSNDRTNYITSLSNFEGYPKLRDTDRILMADGTWKAPNELNVNDLIKTINVLEIDTSNEGADLNITLDTFNQNASYVTDRILGISYLNTLTRLGNITFTDGSTWSDGEYVYFLTDSNDNIKWKQIHDLVPGDQLIAVDTNNETTLFTELKTIQSVELTKDFFTGWVISVENDHLFIVKDTIHNNVFSLIEHNSPCGGCQRGCIYQCLACPSKSQPACTPTGQAICVAQC